MTNPHPHRLTQLMEVRCMREMLSYLAFEME
jgi:hypothetical protein